MSRWGAFLVYSNETSEHPTPLCRSMSRGRALSVAKPAAGSGLKDAAQRNAAVKAGDRAQRRSGKMARKVTASHSCLLS